MRIHGIRHPKVGADPGCQSAPEMPGSDPDHGVRPAVQPHFAAEHAGIGRVSGAPIIVSQDDHRVRPLGGILLGQERSAERGLNAHHLEVIARDHFSQDELRVAGRRFDPAAEHAVLGDVLEDVRCALRDELVGGIAIEEVLAVARQRIDIDQLVGIADAPILEQHCVDQ